MLAFAQKLHMLVDLSLSWTNMCVLLSIVDLSLYLGLMCVLLYLVLTSVSPRLMCVLLYLVLTIVYLVSFSWTNVCPVMSSVDLSLSWTNV